MKTSASSAGRSQPEAKNLHVRKDRWQSANWLQRWFIATRAPVLILTLQAAAIGGLLAALDGGGDLNRWLLVLLGLLLAHASNNLINDYVDVRRGVDTPDYFRARYGTHPLLEGLMTEAGMRWMIAATGLAALASAMVLTAILGPTTLFFILPGAACLLFYTAPMKSLGLGELAVFLVWGPLMIGGTDYALSESVSLSALCLGLLLGLPATLVIFGKHIDKLEEDRRRGIRTLPVRLGHRAAGKLMASLIALLFGGQALAVATGALPLASLATLLTAWQGTRLAGYCLGPTPAKAPQDYPEHLWPLWLVAHAFRFAASYSSLLILGLILAWLPA